MKVYVVLHTLGGGAVTKTAKVTISLPEPMLRAADEAGAREHRSRSELIREALLWYLRLGQLPVERATPEDLAAIEAGRGERARGESLSLDAIRHELGAEPGGVAVRELADDAGLGAQDDGRVGVGAAAHGLGAAPDHHGPAQREEAGVGPALVAVGVLDQAPDVVLVHDADRQAGPGVDPVDRVVLARAGADVDLAGRERGEAGQRQAARPRPVLRRR